MIYNSKKTCLKIRNTNQNNYVYYRNNYVFNYTTILVPIIYIIILIKTILTVIKKTFFTKVDIATNAGSLINSFISKSELQY